MRVIVIDDRLLAIKLCEAFFPLSILGFGALQFNEGCLEFTQVNMEMLMMPLGINIFTAL